MNKAELYLDSLSWLSDIQASKTYLDEVGVFELLNSVFNASQKKDGILNAVDIQNVEPFRPDYCDLAKLHFLARKHKSIEVLEFGSGFSTMILAHAMKLNRNDFLEKVQGKFRNPNLFCCVSVEENQVFFNATKRYLEDTNLDPFGSVVLSSVTGIDHLGRVATIYESIPAVSPDFVFLDGPSQFAWTGSIRNVQTNDVRRMPMSADLIALEYYLEPGTIILVDGRTNNARFLRDFFRRRWVYAHDIEQDLSCFVLDEPPIGLLNRAKMQFWEE